ncbi:FUSC family protein [Virgibacillus sp. MSP4-1]|uniref:FUSC family protein n=1 Tax=Virgibacillus sp. MSP4-1 TaxID=2700081 RepID=UPI0005C4E431|nr:FUSC family protein [Virgibacillus sp. MSP4-1]QHS21769.1 FUSC family protein [Virgibacillus sp. MSP4-1]
MTEQTTKNSELLSVMKQALKVNKKPFPWVKAFSAGLAASLPILIGLLAGHLDYGLIAAMGGFTYLYVFDVPYAQKAKKLLFVILGLTLVTALGTLVAPYPLAIAIVMGLIGAAAIFMFGALRIAGPSAIFFVLVFAMTTGMPVQPEDALLRAGLVFSSGMLSFVIAMLGWFFKPHGPETNVVKRLYEELASLLESVGTETFNEAKHRVMSALRDADHSLAAGYIPWRKTDYFKRLYLLNSQAHKIFLYIVENFSDDHREQQPELAKSVHHIAKTLDQKNPMVQDYKNLRQSSDKIDEKIELLLERIYDADAIMNEPASRINQDIPVNKQSILQVLGGAFDKNSIVFITALRFGFVTIIAAIIAYEFGFARSYWVPLSSVAVMSGFSIVATYHRGIQRAFGTFVGILIASFILSIHPSGYLIALFVLILTFITELFIVKNYGLAALFFTPNALLMAESTSQGGFSFSYFASARIIDVMIGSLIGLMGVWMMGRKSASSRLPHLITKTIRSQSQLLLALFSNQGKGFDATESRELRKMRTNLNNLNILYNTAAGEVPVDRKALDYYWSVLYSMNSLSYLLENGATDNRPELSDEVLAQLLYVCESMANAASRKRIPTFQEVPPIEKFPSIQKEIIALQKSLRNEASV